MQKIGFKMAVKTVKRPKLLYFYFAIFQNTYDFYYRTHNNKKFKKKKKFVLSESCNYHSSNQLIVYKFLKNILTVQPKLKRQAQRDLALIFYS